MNINRMSSSESLHLFSDEELDAKGNLKDLVVDDDPIQAKTDSKQKKGKLKRIKKHQDKTKVDSEGPALKKRKITELFDLEISDDEDLYQPRENEDPVFLEGKIFHELYTSLDEIHPKEIVGRLTEAQTILSMIMQPQGGVRPLLLGTAGIGKYTLVKKVAMLMKTTMKDFPLGNKKIFCLDCNEIIADSVSESMEEIVGEKIRGIMNQTLKTNKDPIFYFRDIDKILHLNHVTEYLQSILRKPQSFIASISEDARSENVIKSSAILSKYNFTNYPVEETPIKDVQTIVQTHLKKNRIHPNLAFTTEAVDLGIRLAGKYVHNHSFPVKAINLIQECANNLLLNNKMHDKFLVTPKDIAEMVSIKTKVPALDLMDDSIFNQSRFTEKLRYRVVGQNYALNLVSDRVAVYKMKLADNKKPWGVFLFVGPTGVGKTELAKTLAKILFEDETNLITINGSEYIEDHTVSNLIGSPKGYEGNDSGGLLTEPLKKNPHQVVLLDEFEKAHINVQRLFLQVFDSGVIIDRKGDRVDCSPTLFIMTSNTGSEMLCKAAANGGMSPEKVITTLIPTLKKVFSPELVGRFKRGIVPFQPLNKSMMPDVANVKLAGIKERLLKDAEIDLTWTPELIKHFAESDVDVSFGMREFCNLIDETVVSIIKDAMIQSNQRITGKVELTYNNAKQEFFMNIRK